MPASSIAVHARLIGPGICVADNVLACVEFRVEQMGAARETGGRFFVQVLFGRFPNAKILQLGQVFVAEFACGVFGDSISLKSNTAAEKAHRFRLLSES